MYKVFFNDRTIYLDDTLPEMSEVSRDYVCAFENITDLKPQVRQFLAPGKTGNLYIFHDDKDALLKTFSQCFKVIKASGGLVGNNQGELLLIFRRGKWDLPKGKAEKGETSEETAIREVEEEVGLKGIKIKRFLRSTYHIYMLEDQSILKKTEWYEMEYHGEDQPTPNTAEDITEVRWVKPGELNEMFANTYPSVKQVLSGSE
jgi:8-oxo-dGTP pyrophosphatase MutT (NUDIX family)